MVEGGGAGVDSRRWDELIPDALALIFSNLSLQEILTVVPRVCRSWGKVVMGPYCWQEIDIEDWSSRSEPERVDCMVRMLITRSCGSVRKLCVSGLHNDLTFSFIAEHTGALQTLCLPRSQMKDPIIEQIAGKLSTVTFMDLSYCGNITGQALEAIGKHCKFLSKLRRNMHPLDTDTMISQVDEAHAIATTMPKLKELEIAYLLIDTESVLEIFSCCGDLELLDLRGCWSVKLEEKEVKEKYPKLKVLGPHVEQYEKIEWDYDCSDYSDTDSFYDYESFDGMWDEDDDERLEVMFYEGFGEYNGYGWPPSP